MRVGVLTGGGDCPGLNAVIRAVVRKGVFHYQDEFVGFIEGWRGVVENKTMPLTIDTVSGILQLGGTILRTSRTNPRKMEGGIDKCLASIAANKLDALITIGGDDTQGVANALIEKGVKVFRVDNPHTKALPFWEWCIAEVRRTNPEVIFLAEAFTRPHVMYGLAKLGYTQSYTYFSWRTEKRELTEYMTELTTEPVSDSAIVILAATLGASYGIYGPAFELREHLPAKPGSEEYLDSEKYQLRTWDRDDPMSLTPLLTLLNHTRKAHPALQSNDSLRFHTVDNDHLIAYSKRSGADVVLVIVNLDPESTQTGMTDLDLLALDLPLAGEYEAHDVLSGELYTWNGARNYVALDPEKCPAHILLLRPKHLSENTAGESTED